MKILREDEKDVLQFANKHPSASIGRLLGRNELARVFFRLPEANQHPASPHGLIVAAEIAMLSLLLCP
jgi:hypothetical protein